MNPKRWLQSIVAVVATSLLCSSPGLTDEPRTIDATNIEGELRLPEVLFITARDLDRPLDFLDWAWEEAAKPAHLPPTASLHVVPLGAPEPIVPDNVLALARQWALEAANAAATTTEPEKEDAR